MTNEYFKKALHNFTQDVANGDAIRHLTASGMTVKEISENLSYPAPMERIRSVVWEYYIRERIICLTDPTLSGENVERYDYIKETDAYGHTSFRRVSIPIMNAELMEYVPVDFGKEIYKNSERFLNFLERLEPRDKEYILGIPWPLETVYHVKDDRMTRILEIYKP